MAMTVHDIDRLVDSWAPKELAWEKDNVGLQCGDPMRVVRSLLVALDPSEAIVAESVRRSVDLIITHHPLLFRPVRKIDLRTSTGRVIQSLLAARISLLSAHTNLDASPFGTNAALAKVLKLTNASILHRPHALKRKIVTFVPAGAVDTVAEALSEAGAGRIGNYERCSFRSEGVGTFLGNDSSHPRVGVPHHLETVPEVRLEMIVDQWNLDHVLSALKASHPYEEPAFDVVALENRNAEHGLGMIGDLARPVALAAFLKTVKRQLGIPFVRISPGTKKPIKRVAVCGGAGGELLEEAVRQGADLFITADVKYNVFHEAAGRIVVVDAGHFETENPVVGVLASRLRDEFHRRQERIVVRSASTPANPVRYV